MSVYTGVIMVKGSGDDEIQTLDLNGVRMTVSEADACSVVNASTILTFEQLRNVVSGRYRGGEIVDGYLIGHLNGWSLLFVYIQSDLSGRLDAGISEGILDRLPDGRLRLTERFQCKRVPVTV